MNHLNKIKLDIDLKNHMLRVAKYAKLLTTLMSLDYNIIDEITIGATLHDIGKKLINQNILNKPSKLTNEEFEIIKKHSKFGLNLLNKIYKNKDIIVNIILFHHEKWDGSGYPMGLKKTEIPLEARVISIVDCYDALTSNRVYKNKISHKKALKILKNQSGQSFDPDIILIFEKFEKKFKELLKSYTRKNER